MHRSLRRKLQTRESGQTLILFTLFIIVLILFVGLGIDLGFAYITRAQLSKAVDAACLTGIRNYNSTNVQGAKDLAASTFRANYGTSGRDVAPVVLDASSLTFSAVHNNITLDVNATTRINTFFIRVLPALLPAGPSWKTLTVGSSAQATRPNLIMSLVLDRSGSMNGNGGAAVLPGAVSRFIDLFDDQQDRVAMASFSYAASTDVTMRRPFKTAIKNAVSTMGFEGWTCSERGLTNGLAENVSVIPQQNEKVVRVVLFFSDGLANTWYWPGFDCGARNIAPGHDLYDPNTGAGAGSGCTVPATIPSIDGQNNVPTSSDCGTHGLYDEALLRAERIALLARQQDIIIYAIGFGDENGPQECLRKPLNRDFLKNLANTPDSLTHVQGQPEGDYVIAAKPEDIDPAFQAIASKILGRLTK